MKANIYIDGVNMKHVLAILALIVAGLLIAAERPIAWAVPMVRAGLPNLHRVDAKLYRSAQPTAEGMTNLVRILRQDWKVEDAITEMKDGGYGYHSIWFHLPRFIRKTAKELK